MPILIRRHSRLRLLDLCAFGILVLQSSLLPASELPSLTLNSTTQAPLSTRSHQGFIDLVAKEALSRVGIQLQTVRLPAERALLDSNSGLLDGEISRVAGLEKIYTNLVPISEKLMDLEFTVFSKNISSLEPGWAGLAKHSAAFLTGWKILEKNVPKETELTKVQSPSQLFNLLALDRVELIIYERWSGINIIKQMKLAEIRPLSPPIAVRSMHMYLHKKHAKLAKRLDAALKDMKSDGTFNRIYLNTLQPLVDQ